MYRKVVSTLIVVALAVVALSAQSWDRFNNMILGRATVIFSPDNTYDIGASGATRPRYIYAGTAVYSDHFRSPSYFGIYNTSVDGVIQLTNNAGDGFAGLIFGTNNATGIRLKKNGTTLQFTTGDGTTDAIPVQALSFGSNVTTGTLITNDAQTVANAGVISLGTNASLGLIIVTSTEDGAVAEYSLNGSNNSVNEYIDPVAIFSNTAGTASSINIYWSAGNSRYELQNNRGSSRSIRLIRLGV